MKFNRSFLFLRFFLLVFVSGCAYPISAPLRQQARPGLSVPMILENPNTYRGAVVIWGGIVQVATPQAEGSELIVQQFPLDWCEEPRVWAEPQGRFVIKTTRYLDPAIYCKGRRITVAGEIMGSRTVQAGKSQLRFPEITSRELYLWPRLHIYGYYSPYPYWNWPNYYYGPYYQYYGPYSDDWW